MLDPRGRRLQADGQAAAGRHRHRPRAHRHRRCCARRAWSGKFVEFFGHGLAGLPLADRATIANMAPEYGAHLRLLPDRRRDAQLPRGSPAVSRDQVALVEAYAKAQGLWRYKARAPSRSSPTRSNSTSATVRALAGRSQAPAGPRAPVRSAGAGLRKTLGQDVPKATPSPAATGVGTGDEGSRLSTYGDGDVRDRRDHLVHQHLQPRR
jgi:hypothetical protein